MGKLLLYDNELIQTLPQNLIVNTGSLLDACDSITDWVGASSPAGGSVALENTIIKEGTGSLKVVTPGASGREDLTKTCNWTMNGIIRFWAYTDQTSTGNAIALLLSNDTGFTKYFYYSMPSANVRFLPGWNLFSFIPADFTSGAGIPSWNEPIVRFRIRAPTTGAVKTWYFDKIISNLIAKPAICITFDDSLASQYSLAFPFLYPRKIRATAYTTSDWVGGVNQMTWAQLRQLQSAGWTIGNHGKDGTDLTTLTEAQQETALTSCDTALENNGIIEPRKYFASPGGAFNADTLTALAALGFRSNRTIQHWFERMPFQDIMRLGCQETGAATTLVTMKGWIDTAVTRKDILIVNFHKLVASSPTGSDVLVSTFQDWVTYGIQQGVPFITMNDLYKLQSGSITIPRL